MTAQVVGMRQVRHNRLTRAAALWFVVLGGVAIGQESSGWKTGPAFRQELDKQVSVAKSEQPLRQVLASLSQSFVVAVFLDRRIDPGQMVGLIVRDQPLQVMFTQLAAAAKAQMTHVGPVVYIGPPETASKLATLAAIRRKEVAQLPRDAKSRLLRAQAWRWDERAEPRQLLNDLARQAGVTIENPDMIPHDLWPAVSLPPLPWTDRLTLLLAGFGLTFEFTNQGAAVRLVPIPEGAVVLEHAYTTRGAPAATAAQLRRIVPDAKIRVEQGKLVVTASQEDHETIERLLSQQNVRTTKTVKGRDADKRYTLQTDKAVSAGALLRKIAENLGKELKCDEAALPKLQQRVDLSVKEATLDQLLAALERALKPLALTFKVTDDALEVAATE
jgi:hypothetical protein